MGRRAVVAGSGVILGILLATMAFRPPPERMSPSRPLVPPASPGPSVGLEAVRLPAVVRSETRPLPEASVEAFVDAWAAGDRVAARRVSGRGVYRDLTRLASRFAMAEQPTGSASAICSEVPELVCRVYLPDMLEVDARLAERHGDVVVLGFRLPAAG